MNAMIESSAQLIVPAERVEKSGRDLAPINDEGGALLTIIARASRDPSIDMDRMERLLKMQEAVMAKRAEQAFVNALSEFKAEPLSIRKNKHVSFTTMKGTTEYDHATLDEVCRAVNPGLSAVGLGYRWLTEQGEGGRIKVTCILTHKDGHSERTSLLASPDDSGGKNNIQAIGSAVSYLQRYTLLASLGVATGGADNDGRGDAPAPEIPRITAEQEATIAAMIEETGTNKDALLLSHKIGRLADLQPAAYENAMSILRKRVRK